MAKALSKVKIVPRRSSDRGHADHGWLDSFHTFSFANYYDPRFQSFGALRVLNEDRVAANSGFPTHPHRDAEIFSYILSGELTHRDSMVKKGSADEGKSKDDFYRMRRGDVQFTTGGSGIAHSEQNEGSEEVHFLQIWALPWQRGLTPKYHTATFDERSKKNRFVTIISPLKAGPGASVADEKASQPAVEGSIPIHSDLLMGAAIIDKDASATWKIGGDGGLSADRNVYVHLPMAKTGAKVQFADGTTLSEGDGVFVTDVNTGDELVVESIGNGKAEVVVLDSALV